MRQGCFSRPVMGWGQGGLRVPKRSRQEGRCLRSEAEGRCGGALGQLQFAAVCECV